ncbi:MAG: hypothetical protein K0Q59_5600, partial [Paenibacillus sp.]|nr:hypothetical protein [Paenibacillus sp.]
MTSKMRQEIQDSIEVCARFAEGDMERYHR